MKMKKRFAVVVLFFIIFLFLVLSNDEVMRNMQLPILGPPSAADISCYEKFSSIHSFPRFNVVKEHMRLASGKNIFFHETSCYGEDGQAELNCRQACAVESAARMNPSMSVNLLFLSPSPPSNRTSHLVEQLLAYPNIRISRVYISDYIKDTPIEEWYSSGILGTSHWPRSHMSDIMRYLTLWKFGGIYLDLDVVITTSLEDLENFAGAEDWMDVAAGVIGFSAEGLGRRVANACLRDLLRNFRGDVWGNNGPGVITRTLQKFCAVEHAKDMTPPRCSGFQVFPPSAFYPIFYKNWKRYFSTEHLNETMRSINNARAIHVWNKLSADEVVQVGSQVPYTLIASKYCPRAYNNCGSTF